MDSSLRHSAIIPQMVALQHCPFQQLHYQISEPPVPLVLRWITATTTVHQ